MYVDSHPASKILVPCLFLRLPRIRTHSMPQGLLLLGCHCYFFSNTPSKPPNMFKYLKEMNIFSFQPVNWN
jgi:hypothetical protein